MGRRMLVPLALTAATLVGGLIPEHARAQAPTQPLVELLDLQVESVTVEDGRLVANALATLDVVGRTVTRNVEIPLELGGSPGAEGECDILNLALGPIDLNLLGLVVALDDCEGGPVTVDIVAIEGGGLLGDLLCEVAGLLDGGLDLGNILEGLSADELAVVTGGIEDVLNAILDEVLMTNVLTAHISAASHQGGCEILNLEIPEGLTLNLLGLEVDTSGICLDIHAERGSGNLLGNLLCSLTGLLDNNGNNAGGQQALVRNILRQLDRLGL
jgi:hypothetical protein